MLYWNEDAEVAYGELSRLLNIKRIKINKMRF